MTIIMCVQGSFDNCIDIMHSNSLQWYARLFLFVMYTLIRSITSSEMCSLHLTHPRAHTPGAVAPGEQSGVRCLAQGSHLSRGQFLPEPRFEPTTSGYKSNALSIRSRLPQEQIYLCTFKGKHVSEITLFKFWCNWFTVFYFGLCICFIF